MGISLETLALAKKYADKVAAADSDHAMQQAIETAVRESNIYTDKAIGELTKFNVTIVQSLPTENIKTHTIYFVPASPLDKDGYYEYMYINGKWELIGNTRIDLSNYYTKQEIEQYISDNKYVLPIASSSTLGGVKIDESSILIDENGMISVSAEYVEDISQDVVDENLVSIEVEDIANLF